MSTTSSDHDEQLLVRRVVTVVCGLALLSVPLLQFVLGASESWLTVAHFLVLGTAFAALGRSRLSTAQVVIVGAVLLWVVTATSMGMTAVGTVTGDSEGVGLGTGMLWLAAGMGPALFLVMEVRRALVATLAAFAAAVVVLVLITGGQVRRLLEHPGLWQVLVATLVVLCATAAVAWLAGRSADERHLAQLLRQERAERTARLEASQHRRAKLFSRTATDLRIPMQELATAAGSLRVGTDAAEGRDGLARVEQLAADLLDRVVEHIDGLVARIHDDAGPAPVPVEEPVREERETDVLATVLMTFGVFAMVGFDAWRTILLAADGTPEAHAVAAGANRMVVVLFLAAAVLAVRFPGAFGWWLSGLVLLAHPIAVLGLVDPVARDALLVPYLASWRVAILATGMIAVLAVIIERRVQDRDALVAEATDEEVRSAELQRRDRASELAYAEAAHELKNPLSVIKGSARTLAEHADALSQPQSEQLRTALARAIERLDARLAVMRGVAEEGDPASTRQRIWERPGAGGGRPVAAADVLLDALAAARLALGDQPVDVDVRVTGDWTSATPNAVEHVLENLLSNAHKYGDPDGMVRLTAHREGREIVVEVANRGGDLTRADAARIFEPYWRAANADDHAEGTGIGLAVVARLVEQWGGRCWARVGGGWTRVGFTMPVAESVQAPTWQELQDQLG